MSFTESNERRVVVDLVFERLTHWVGDDASRETASAALGTAKFRAGLSDEVRDAVLERFEPERLPVAGKDFLPTAVSDGRAQEILDGLNERADWATGWFWVLRQPEVVRTDGFRSPRTPEVELRDGTLMSWASDIARWEFVTAVSAEPADGERTHVAAPLAGAVAVGQATNWGRPS